MADVSANINGVVESDGTGGGLQRVGSTENVSALLDNILTLPNGGKNGAGLHVLEQRGEEGLLLEVGVVLSEELLVGVGKLDGDKLETSLLESVEDRSDESSLDTVGLGLVGCWDGVGGCFGGDSLSGSVLRGLCHLVSHIWCHTASRIFPGFGIGHKQQQLNSNAANDGFRAPN